MFTFFQLVNEGVSFEHCLQGVTDRKH